MTAILRTRTQNREHDYKESGFPLAVAVTLEKEPVFGRDAESFPSGWFGILDGQVFFQPVEGYSVRFNNNNLTESTWLNHGDMIDIETSVIKVSVEGGLLILSYDTRQKAPVLTPPEPVKPEKVSADNVQAGLTPLHGPDNDMGPGGSNPVEDQYPSEIPFIAPLPREKSRSGFHKIILGIFLLLIFGAVFVVAAIPVTIEIDPAPESFSMSRFPFSIKLGGRFLTLPGNYRVSAQKAGYRDLEETVSVRFGEDGKFRFKLEKLPGLLSIKTGPVQGAEVMVDGISVGVTPLDSAPIEAGHHELTVTAQRYLPVTKMIEMEGMEKSQSMDIALEPGWGTLKIESIPEGAEVWLNDTQEGVTPLITEPMKGAYRVELKKDGWAPVSENIEVEPGGVIEMEPIKLRKVSGMVVVTSDPMGASVAINNKFYGNTPVSTAILPGVEHELSITKNGYSPDKRKIKVTSGETMKVIISLMPEYGIVFITSEPADAALKVDGKDMGIASQRLRLTALPHSIEIYKDGYESYSGKVLPEKGISKKLNISLKKDNQYKDTSNKIKTAEDQVLIRAPFTKPVRFRMGSSRREPGRRSNESQYMVELTRTFFISEHEVTNGEFRKFRKEHNSGMEYGYSLNEKDQPVTSVTWDDAAAYLNWLSEKDGLTPAYIKENDRMVAVAPVPSGYRLPTEAEWAFVARYQGGTVSGGVPMKFPWGEDRYPKDKCGNFADTSAKNNLPLIINNYNDGYKVTAPVGQYPANGLGIYDLGGNVSEWCHDLYDIQSVFSNRVLTDPTGPASGKYHVVRGSSWRHGSITELRLTYRDYTDKGRNDIGFRIARYEDDKK